MIHNMLGSTGLEISRLGIGLAEIGFKLTPDQVDIAGRILNDALDAGITFLDTAGCYGISEDLVGATVSARRDDFVLASKTGHMDGDCGENSWSYDCVMASIELSLVRLKTDHVDLMQLHSCDVEILERGEAIRALLDARDRGHARFTGFSGDNEAAIWAAQSGHFEVIQTSFNVTDQRPREELFRIVRDENLGLIAKRPIANAVWGRDSDPDPYSNAYTVEYFARQAAMREDGPLADEPDDPILASLGFTLSHDEVSVAIVGSRDAGHVHSNVDMLAFLPLSEKFIEAAHRRFEVLGSDWRQQE